MISKWPLSPRIHITVQHSVMNSGWWRLVRGHSDAHVASQFHRLRYLRQFITVEFNLFTILLPICQLRNGHIFPADTIILSSHFYGVTTNSKHKRYMIYIEPKNLHITLSDLKIFYSHMMQFRMVRLDYLVWNKP